MLYVCLTNLYFSDNNNMRSIKARSFCFICDPLPYSFNPITSTVSNEFFTIEIIIFIRPTRGHGGPYRVLQIVKDNDNFKVV